MNAYAYRALEGPEYIRLIVLHPALSKATPLRIDFVSSKLEDVEGDYDAVSYTWGKPVLTFPLFVDEDGTQVNVTENLDRALRYLRYETRERTLWADAACINQKDNEDKAIQIPLMVQIFRGARRVMAWLDPGGDTTVEQKGIRLLDRISRLSTTTRTDRSYKDFSTILRFLNLSWFNRLWIVQEVVFNLEVCLICGEMELPLSRLISALSIMKNQGLWHETARSEAIVEIGKLWNLHSLFRDSAVMEEEGTIEDEPQIFHLLEKFWLYECTDPRDRIFALCSMANDVRPIEDSGDTDSSSLSYSSTSTEDDCLSETDESLSMPTAMDRHLRYQSWQGTRIDIDYSLDVRESYEAFAVAYLMQENTAEFIWKALFMRQHSPPPVDWPSWVPDWRVPPRKMRPWYWVSDGNFRKIATGILRVGISVTRSIVGGKGEQLYTVNFKISKETKGSHKSFDFQLLQLHQMLQIPETAQGPHQHPIHSASTPRKLNLMNFPNLLVRMIMKYLFQYDPLSSGGWDVYSNLEHYLARMSRKPDLQHSSEPSYDYVRPLVEGLAKSLGNSNTLFSFRDPGTGVNSVGFGNVALELGDSLLPMYGDFRMPRGDDLRTDFVYILRPIYTMEVSDGEKQVYRLVGNACIFDPTTVLLWMENNRLRGIGQVVLSVSDTMRKQEEEKKALFSSFGIHEFDQVVYLA